MIFLIFSDCAVSVQQELLTTLVQFCSLHSGWKVVNLEEITGK